MHLLDVGTVHVVRIRKMRVGHCTGVRGEALGVGTFAGYLGFRGLCFYVGFCM